MSSVKGCLYDPLSRDGIQGGGGGGGVIQMY